LARSKYELSHWAKSILTHYFMEIFVGQTIIKTFALLYLLQHLIGDSNLTSIDCSLTLIAEIGGEGA
jgi:hypothetical protein